MKFQSLRGVHYRLDILDDAESAGEAGGGGGMKGDLSGFCVRVIAAIKTGALSSFSLVFFLLRMMAAIMEEISRATR